MLKKAVSFYLLKWCLLLVCSNVFSQTIIYKSDFAYDDFKPSGFAGSIIMAGENVLFNASNQKVYSIAKKDGKINWEIDAVTNSEIALYPYNKTFFYGKYHNGVSRVVQFNLNTGEKIKDLPLTSLNTEPFFLNNIMYCTALADGGLLVAYNMDENKIVWQKNIGFGVDVRPIYLKDKIIVNAEDDNWLEIGYDGNFLNTKSKRHIYLDTTQMFVNNYKFLTHDCKEITADFLKKNKLSNSDCQIKTNDNQTFILSENQLLILGNNKKKVLQLDLEKEFPTDDFSTDSYRSILALQSESIWFCYQNFLIQYDFIKKKRLRKVDLRYLNPHQVLLENRTIWLLSGNNGQLYGLDFEPDQQTADKIQAIADHYKCTEPDAKKIEAAKAAQEKIKNTKP